MTKSKVEIPGTSISEEEIQLISQAVECSFNARQEEVGRMKGMWAVLLKAALAAYPFILGWCIWLTVEQFKDQAFRGTGPRYTHTEAELQMQTIRLEKEQSLAKINIELTSMRREMMERFNAQPPEVWRQKIETLQERLRQVEIEIIKLQQ